MSGIVLSASVRQNLLSLQSTAQLLATTQNRLSTGNKVSSALDNPTNFFTAQSLDNRASDINNLLDGIGNGVQVLQAANTGITSLQKLVDAAKSVATQALQTNVGFTKSSVTTGAIAGATATNLLGTTAAPTDATFAGAAATASSVSAYTTTAATAGSQLYSASATNATGSTLLSGLTNSTGTTQAIANNDTLTVNGKTITFATGAAALAGGGSAYTMGIDTSLDDLAAAINTLQGGGAASSVTGGVITLDTGTVADLAVTGSAGVLTALGLSAAAANTATRGGGAPTTPSLAGSTLLSGTASASNSVLSAQFAANDTITVNGQTLTFKASGATGANEIDITADVSALLAKIDGLSGGTGSAVTGGIISLHTGTTSDLTITSSNTAALTALGLGTGVTQARTPGAASASGQLGGLTLTIGATGGGTATNIIFGTGPGEISTLNQLNAALVANNLQAAIDSTGRISLTTTNDAASSTIGAISGTAAAAGAAFNGLVGPAAVADPTSQNTRASLVTQYNNIIAQITTTAQDASFNGINLLGGDQLKLTFNETGTSILNITGVNFSPTGLGLSNLIAGTDFIDNAATNKVMAALNGASSTLRSQASTLGSNLSIVQIRQDFSKNLINVLQTGSANLTIADTNEEAANSQALSTRQSIAVSALALANQSQQSVLKLLQ